MINAFRQIPEPLQKQILYKLGYGAAALLFTAALLICKMDFSSILSSVIIVIFCAVSSFSLFRKAITGDYIAICGECLNVIQTFVKKRTKMIVIRTNGGYKLKVVMKYKRKKINTGSKIVLYVASNMPVYERDGDPLLYSYLAIDSQD